MEDNFTNQEEHLRSLSENFSLEIDTSELWDNIESQLPPVQEERKRPLVWWFTSGVLILAIAILVWNNQSKAFHNNVSTETITETIKSENNKTIDLETKHTQISPETIIAAASTGTRKSSITNKAIGNPVLNSKSTESTKENFSPIFNSDRYDDKSRPWNDGLIDQSTTLQNEVEALINPSSNIIKEQKMENKIESRGLISLETLNSGSINFLQKDAVFDFPIMMIEPLNKTSWLPYYVLSSGVNMHRTNIYNNATEGLDLTQFENERPLLGISSDFHLGFENNNGWRFGFGLNYNRIVTGFSLIESDTIIGEIEGSPSSKIDDEGNISYLEGTVLQTSIINYDLNWHRKHDILNAQLSIGKRIFKTGKLSMFTDASVGKSIWSNHSGYYYTEGNKSITKFESNENNPYSNAGYNVGLSMDVEYQINKISISFKPFAKMSLNSITQNSNYYQLKNSLYGIQLGIVYRP